MAHRAVRAAGDSLLGWNGMPEVEWKGRIDPVSEADRKAEQTAVSVISDEFPADLIVGEESTGLSEPEVRGRRRWYLDPLDGTTNYLRRRPHWCVSLALVDQADEAACAAVYSPPTGELFLAERGEGAACNGALLKVQDRRTLDRAVVGSGFPYSFDDPRRTNLAEWSAVTVRALSMRCSGAAALDLCDVAQGRLDAFWEMGLERWDIAAGALVAREAGALTTSLQGASVTGASTEILAAAPELHAVVLRTLSAARTNTSAT